MEPYAILHISDLHFGGEIKYDKINFKNSFFECLESCVKDKIKIKYLIISGDVANSGEPKEYILAAEFIQMIINKLELDKKNVLICPGNHDVSWTDLKMERRSNYINAPKAHEQHNIKFKIFKEFYDTLFNGEKIFEPKDAIFDKIINDDDNLLICGVNSCYRESDLKEDHMGYISESIVSEMEFLEEYESLNKLMVMHHNPKDLGTEGHDLTNWKELRDVITKYFPTILCGHIHQSDGEGLITHDEYVYYVSVGSLTKKDIPSTFNLYIISPDETKGKICYYQYMDENTDKVYWQDMTSKRSIHEFTIRNEKQQIDSLCTNTTSNNNWEGYSKKWEETSREGLNTKVIENNDDVLKEKIFNLITYVQKYNLFKSGHFHWNDNFRTHGLIDINFLVSRKEPLEYIVKMFYNKIKAENIDVQNNVMMIAIGIECNIIGARLSVLFPNYHYSFIPDPDKKEYSDVEKEIKEGNFKNIILLKDIIFEAKSTKKLFGDLKIIDKNIYVFSLFYCGKKTKEKNIFGTVNIIHSSICNEIEIPKCQYSSGKEKCPIAEYKLEQIYER